MLPMDSLADRQATFFEVFAATTIPEVTGLDEDGRDRMLAIVNAGELLAS